MRNIGMKKVQKRQKQDREKRHYLQKSSPTSLKFVIGHVIFAVLEWNWLANYGRLCWRISLKRD